MHKFGGLIAILGGVIIALATVAGTAMRSYILWNGEMAFKQSSFDSFADYYFTVNKGALLIAAVIAGVSICIGVYLRRR